MKNFAPFLALFLLCQTAFAQSDDAFIKSTSQYVGKINTSQVRVALNYYSDGSVAGNYVSFKTGKKYFLKGHNLIQGKLILREYTKNRNGTYRESSISTLTKSVIKGKIVWSGTMRNYDGRNVPVTLVKK
ncbi:MAG: hypothetical protein PVJ98_03890 [Akkermansiaceae bacterium]|jgi:uncharacterized protein YcsI (UPF0317 family)